MGQGQGSVTVNQKAPIIPPPGPPFAATSADNGLSVDPITGRIVLGNDVPGIAAMLLSSREIRMNGNDLLFGNQLFDSVVWNINAGNVPGDITGWAEIFQFGDLVAGVNFLLDEVAQRYRMGAIGFGHGNGTLLDLDDAAGTAIINSNFATGLLIDMFNDAYFLGGNNSFFFTDSVGSTSETWVAGSRFESADLNTNIYLFGDADDNINGNKLSIDDGTQEWAIGQRTAVTNLLLNKPAAGIGLSFFDSAGNNPFLLPDPTIGGIAFMSSPDFTMQLSLADAGNGSVGTLGDIGALGNNTLLVVDDVANRVFTTNFTEIIGTTTAYTNNAAAAAATLLNAPVAGNPTKWIPINDNGTIRNIPAW